MVTEREWRRYHTSRRRSPAVCLGAQYVLDHRQKLRQDKAFHVFLLLLSAAAALLLPLVCESVEHEAFEELSFSNEPSAKPRSVSAISYVFPSEQETEQKTYTFDQLLRGKLLLLDERHALPPDVPAPNTMSIALAGKGMIPVRNLQIRSGRETIQALGELFSALRQQGVNGLTVWEGTLSRAQQRAQQEQYARKLMQTLPPDEAVGRALASFDQPGTGEMLQEYTVELRFQTDEPDMPDERPLDATPHGQKLLQTAWRYGFVRSKPDANNRQAFRFRWVGKAHATAMTYLALSFEDYLIWLHEKGTLTIEENGEIKYIILCKPVTGSHIAFSVPKGASCDASLDNRGYAVVACTF